ncbi:hypothetical protein RKE29_26135, partial [Streptomyces sp. B1866]|nr:hypothetical protein [Streptomyces sp. B1866]
MGDLAVGARSGHEEPERRPGPREDTSPARAQADGAGRPEQASRAAAPTTGTLGAAAAAGPAPGPYGAQAAGAAGGSAAREADGAQGP